MYEWNEAVQKMIYWIEEHLTEHPSLAEMSEQIGYSPYYCSTQFHRIVGMTVKNYIAGRKLAKAAVQIRDSNERILDIAVSLTVASRTRREWCILANYFVSRPCLASSKTSSSSLVFRQNTPHTVEDFKPAIL